ncbi:MAG: histidine kinase N-terminal 7TM domain-containing protein [Clostridiaceae bacterium]|nr:histidine kinase N-terminal 7TM domain-containing protein [Clostridiaceae bacterium]
MVLSNLVLSVFIFSIIAICIFLFESIRTRRLMLIHRLYFISSLLFVTWLAALICMNYTIPDNTVLLRIWDSVIYLGCAFIPVLALLIAVTFVYGLEQLPKSCYLLLIVPTLVNLAAWTDPVLHLMYRQFSIDRAEVVFGPFIYLNGVYSYLSMVAAVFIMLRFAFRSRDKLYIKQILMFTLSNLFPLVVSMITTFTPNGLPIYATPLGFIPSILCNGIAIYQLHILDIKPIATSQVLDQISDCYLLLSAQGLVVSTNKPFQNVLGVRYGIRENHYLRDCVREEDSGNSIIFNILTAVQSSGENSASVSYEQALLTDGPGGAAKNYYIVEVTPLVVEGRISGFVVLFKDITQVKRSMQQVQDSHARMMERERLAFLGQMVGGLAHNLKTPIMSISGGCAALDSLIEECRDDLGTGELEEADFREIYGEMDEWITRVRESCGYMSDIITAIKGQAANANASETGTFTLDDLIRRATLLMRHELLSASCSLRAEYGEFRDTVLHGDINNLVQVLNNLLSNAIYAQKQSGGGEIVVGIRKAAREGCIDIYVRDTGPGIDPHIRKKLLKEMTTSKGAHGTGLGLYISNAIIRGKFGGTIWFEDNPGGGAVFGMEIPLVPPQGELPAEEGTLA